MPRFLYSGYGSATMQRMPIGGGAWTPVRGVEATSFIAFAKDSAIWWGSHVGVGTYRHGVDGRDSLVFPGSTIAQILPGDRYAVGLGLTTGIQQRPCTTVGSSHRQGGPPLCYARRGGPLHDGVPGVRASRQRDGGRALRPAVETRDRRARGDRERRPGERDRVRPVRRSGEWNRGVHPGLRERPGPGEPGRTGAGPDGGAPALSQPANLARRPPHRVRSCVERRPGCLDLVGNRRPDAGDLPARRPRSGVDARRKGTVLSGG